MKVKEVKGKEVKGKEEGKEGKKERRKEGRGRGEYLYPPCVAAVKRHVSTS